MSSTSNIVIDDRGALLVVTLDRAEKRNALAREMLERLREIFAGVRGRSDLRAVILTGAGREAFCAGTDIAELEGLEGVGALATSRRGQEVCDAIELCNVPVIAAVNGAAAGGGCELALACHLRVAARGASFSLPETRLGVLPAYGGTQRLARAVGAGRALAAMLAGDALSAEEALRLGVVNRVAEPDRLMAEAESLARAVSEHAPLAVRACLEAVTRGARLPLAEGLALEAELFARLFSTEDVREGTRAFLEKRAPDFKGK
ncbi:MAG: enoyl-CoA hydratase/isomerase family protein [Acidobacteria bacterium]|nr:enoyl-CoA hydratase/isomerase family protein [Acidobacteriota bacterium]MCA1643397.1 enoyl-CoA hydratase/isomerase family protein [Acidobacteriota bacterium]